MSNSEADDTTRVYRYEEEFEDSNCPDCPKRVTVYVYTRNPEVIERLERSSASLILDDGTICPRCGKRVEKGARFCPSCGFCLGCED